MKRRWDARRKAEGKPIDKPNLITGPVQICWHKFTRYWDVEHRELPMQMGRLAMTPEEVRKLCDENTIGVVPTLGVTFTRAYEPVAAVASALDKLQEETGLDIPIHVDGACYDTAEYLSHEIEKMGPFEVIFRGERDKGWD